MKKHVDIWNHLADPMEKSLNIMADDYYNESISTITSSYLQNIKQLIVDSEDRVRQKRKGLITEATMTIRKEWESTRNNLVNAVNNWCKDC